ncbi:MAG: CAP domain-containing protein [bacterium]|nr:CAP domain-containing protein [bacterium]
MGVKERNVVRELNLARTDPEAYARHLERLLKSYQGNIFITEDGARIITHEGVSAVEEAIGFLKKSKPIPPLKVSRGLSKAAKWLVGDQGPKGKTGHTGSDGSAPADRMNRYGEWRSISGENIGYGPWNARHHVMMLLIDDGVRGRGHRMNIFDSRFGVVGVACGPHKTYDDMCVMEFAGAYTEKK